MNDNEIVKLQLEAWKVVVETQRHFNDVAMKVRHLGFVLVSAMIGAAGFSLKSGYEFKVTFWEQPIPVASFLLAFTALLWVVIWFLDSKWYTPFLVGSVESGEDLERAISKRLSNIDLTQRIRKKSQSVTLLGRRISSSKRSNYFHLFIVFILVMMSFLLVFFAKEASPSEQTVLFTNSIETSSTPNHGSSPILKK
ncbi:hypothetical protein [Methylophaga sp.]|uniref:hypothetical protein n=1 Tax=Methylophaga sp. TaxID=2024840 RepID=UPI003A8C9DB4